MKNKKLVIASLVLVVVIALMAVLFFATRPEASTDTKAITLVVVHGYGGEKEFTYITDEEYLGPVLLEVGVVQGEMGPYGLEIHTVDAETACWEENQSYWALYIGDEYATTGADGVALTDGGVYKLVYTIG